MKKIHFKFSKKEAGQGLVEFAILLAVFGLALIAIVPSFNDKLKDAYVDGNPTHYSEYIVTYDANGGANAPDMQIKYLNEDLTIATEPTPEWSMHLFKGWAEEAFAPNEGEPRYQPGDIYTEDRDLNLYAVWEDIYTITYLVNSPDDDNAVFEDNSVSRVDLKYYDVDYSIIPDKPFCEYYDFIGWSTEAGSTTAEYQPEDVFTENKNLTLFGVWKLRTYKLEYDPNGGTGTVPESTYNKKNSAVIIGDANLKKTGYQFVGWSTDKTSAYTEYIPYEVFVMPEHDVTLYAVYMPCDFPYNGSDGSDGTWQSFTAPRTGNYKIQLWGADGGRSCLNGVMNAVNPNGGYTEVTVHLEKGQTIYLAVGGHGADNKFSSTGANKNAGGWNGGGDGYTDNAKEEKSWTDPSREGSGGGGGATSATFVLIGDGQLYNYDKETDSIIAVAGGAAGSNYTGNNGYGGGASGGNSKYAGTNSGGYKVFGKGESATGALGY